MRDTSGAVIPRANATLTNEGMVFSVSKAPASDGTRGLTPVKVGMHTVAAEFGGFQKVERPYIRMGGQQQIVADFSLAPSSATEVVESMAAPACLPHDLRPAGNAIQEFKTQAAQPVQC